MTGTILHTKTYQKKRYTCLGINIIYFILYSPTHHVQLSTKIYATQMKKKNLSKQTHSTHTYTPKKKKKKTVKRENRQQNQIQM